MQGEVGGAPSVTESPSVSADNPSLEEGWVGRNQRSQSEFPSAFALICHLHLKRVFYV